MRRLVIFAVVASASGCKFAALPPLDEDAGQDASLSCVDTGADTADPRCPPDRPICIDGTCGGTCDADNDCAVRTDGRNVCLDTSGTCVTCDESNAQAMPGSSEDECATVAAPVCDADTHQCRPCEEHGECSSGVCDNGSCVEQANVIYLDTSGTNTGECQRSAGCLTLQYALTKLTPTRRYILFAPSITTYQTAPDTTDARFYMVNAHVIGYGATLARYNQADAIDIDNSNVTIEGLRISSAGSNGVDCAGGTLVLRDVRLEGATYYGVSSRCDFTMVNSLIMDNRAGGIAVDSGVFRIANNWIIDNGSAASSYGGGRLFTASTQSYFEFNTVAFNRTSTGSTFGDGIHCGGPVGVTLFRNNIIIGSAGQPHLTQMGVDNCHHEYTLVAPDNGVPDTGNLVVSDPSMFMFLDVGTNNYHLQPESIAVGKGNAATLHAESMTDIDGDPRSGPSTEVGADELP